MKFVISLTTVPHRLHLSSQGDHCGSKGPLLTLLNQSYEDFEVHLNIPKIYRARSEVIKIPDWLNEVQAQYDKLKVFRTEDHGPATKLYPTIQRIADPDINIVLADDDLYYCDGFLSFYKEARSRYPDDALGFAGISEIGGKGRHFCTTVDSDARVKHLEGYKTVCLKRSFFDDTYKDFVNVVWNDDVTLSAYLGFKNIKKIVLNYSNDTDFSPRVESFPVIRHASVENIEGCNIFRRIVENDKEEFDRVESIHNNWFKLGYLER